MSEESIKVRRGQVSDLRANHTASEMSRIIGCAKRTIERDIAALDAEQAANTASVVQLHREHVKRVHSRRTDRDLVKRILGLEAELESALNLANSRNTYAIQHKDSPESEAVAIMVASDWHIEAVIKPWEVSGLNEFNQDVCRTRVDRFFRHGVKLLKQAQDTTKIQTLIFAIIGDMISGSIHDELMESNRLLPADAVMEAQGYLESGIRYILRECPDINIIIPMKSGNHGRMTQKRRISTEEGNSLERLLYYAIQRVFISEPRVECVVSDGYHIYIDVWPNFVARFHHGHSTRYLGGSGGLSIPLNKAVLAWNRGRRADLDILGHFHQFLDGGQWLVNGSLCGYDSYALSIKASPEPPRQAFLLIDKNVGKTSVTPIILTEDR